jgi:hypothetical protein
LCIPASYISIDLDIFSWAKFCWSNCFQLPPCVLKAWTTKSLIKPWWWRLVSGFLETYLTHLAIFFKLIHRKWGKLICGPPSKCDKSFKW